MAAARVERRMAAILAADVVGYSALMERDEDRTLARLKAHRRDFIEPLIGEYQGRIVKLMGDGALVEFASVVDAVRCAVLIQKGMAERDLELPAPERIRFRIGINLGDVIHEDDGDIYGDGVNVAARLEQLAEPGGVIVSGTAYDHLQGKLDLPLEFAGEQRVKNIERLVRAYRVRLDGKAARWRPPLRRLRLAVPAGAVLLLALIAAGAWWWYQGRPAGPPVPDEPSVVVLPFDNLGGDSEQGYLADGMTDDMTTDLARVPGLLVISRSAAFQYKDKEIEPAQVAAELGVRYVLEGSVRRVGEELRINAQLIDAATGMHKWAERFDGQWSEVFTLQDNVIRSIVLALEMRLASREQSPQATGGTRNPAAYDAYLKGLELYWRLTPESAVEAISHLKQAVTLDPDYGEANAALAEVYRYHGPDPFNLSSAEFNAAVVACLQEAMKHPSPRAYRVRADLLLQAQQTDAAIEDLQRAINLDPSNGETFEWMSYAMALVGRAQDAQQAAEAASRADPLAAVNDDLGFAYFTAGRFADAATVMERHLQERPHEMWVRMILVAAYGYLERDAKPHIQKIEAQLLKENGVGFSQLLGRVWNPYKRPEDAARLRDGLRMAGVPEFPFPYPEGMVRLTDDEIRPALFGRVLKGRDIDNGASWILTFEPDGAFTFASDSKFASGPSDAGRLVEIQDGVMCWGYPATGNRGCGALFRPKGATDYKKLLWMAHVDRIDFQVVQ